MAEFVKGDVVVVPFPFSDLTQAKRRPALVIATLAGDDGDRPLDANICIIDKLGKRKK
jgi:hypothetical protein